MQHLFIDNWFKKPPKTKTVSKKDTVLKKGRKKNAELRQKTKKQTSKKGG